MHLHAFGYDEYGHPAPPNEVTGQVPAYGSNAAFLSAVLSEMDEHQIVRAVASGPISRIREWQEKAPGLFMGGAYAGGRDPIPPLRELRTWIDSGTIDVLGELGLQYRGIALDDPELEPYWELAEEKGIPVGVHSALGDAGLTHGCCPEFRIRDGNPLLLEDVLARHPDLRLYIMHAGYPFLEETKAILTIYPNVYVDVAVINWAIPREEFHEYLGGLVQAGFGDRVMFGSDQMVWPETIGLAIEGVESATFLTREQRRAIFYDNAARFLQLTPNQIADDHARR